MDELVDLISSHVNDVDNIRYTRELIFWYVSLAYSTIAASNKDDFTSIKTVVLDPGCYHYVCDECQELVDVISINGDSCETPTKISDKGKKLADKFSKYSSKPCSNASEEEFNHGGIEISSSSQCAFKTANPVPEGVETTAEILCAEVPSSQDLVNNPDQYSRILDKYSGMIVNFALYMLNTGDEESQMSLNKATLHWNVYQGLDTRIVNQEVREFNEDQANKQ